MARPLRARWSGGLTRLDWLLTRYWDEAEADLAFRGVSLLAEFQDCRVRFLLNVIQALPRASMTQEAMSQDDELVELLAKGRDPDAVSSPIRWSEFTPEVEALFGIGDRLADVVAAVVASAGKKPPRTSPIKRPETAWARYENRTTRERHLSLVRRVLPNGPQELPPGG